MQWLDPVSLVVIASTVILAASMLLAMHVGQFRTHGQKREIAEMIRKLEKRTVGTPSAE